MRAQGVSGATRMVGCQGDKYVISLVRGSSNGVGRAKAEEKRREGRVDTARVCLRVCKRAYTAWVLEGACLGACLSVRCARALVLACLGACVLECMRVCVSSLFCRRCFAAPLSPFVFEMVNVLALQVVEV